MPVVLRISGYEFFFYSNEGNEPIHVHVEKAEGQGKIWLEPELKIAFMHNFTPRQRKEIIKLTNNHLNDLKREWNEYFKR